MAITAAGAIGVDNGGPNCLEMEIMMSKDIAHNTEVRELTVDELDQVVGGFFARLFAQTGGGQRGQNDPAQMFSQIMQSAAAP
jgi:hypothetical protein